MSADTHIVILAAGSSSRLGSPKQLIDWHGQPLLRHLAGQAFDTGLPVTIILGANSEAIRASIDELPARIIDNPQWSEGMSSSIRLAANGIDAHSLLLMTCDQPHVTAAVLRALIDAYASGPHPIVASEYGDTVGVPALFDLSLFDELRSLSGAQGAKSIILRHLVDTLRVSFPEGALDIDTPDDVARLRSGH